MQHLAAERGQLQHLVIGDGVQLFRAVHPAGIGGVDAVHVGIDLTFVGAQHRRDRDRGGVATSAPQRRHVAVFVDTLEARNQDDAVLVQLPADALGGDGFDPCRAVGAIRIQFDLPAGQTDGGQAHFFQLHGHEGDGDLFADGEQHVHLPLGRIGIDLSCLFDQVVRGVTLGGEHDDDLVSGAISVGDDAGDALDLRGVRNGASAVFLNNQHCITSPYLCGACLRASIILRAEKCGG